MRQKINLRLSMISLIAIMAAALGITVVYYNLFQNQVWDDLQSSTRILKEAEVFQSLPAGEDGDIDSLPDISGVPAGLQMDELRITWVGVDGTVYYDNETIASELPNHMDRPEICTAIESGEGEAIRQSDTLGMDTYYYALRLEDGTVLRVARQASAISTMFLSILPVIAVIAGLILLGCVMIGHALTNQLLEPIEEMAENLEGSNAGSVYKELEPFADTIRRQHENILAAAKSRQDFTANVSHELKTPLTAISGYAELIENHMVGAEEETHIAEQIRHNAARLLSLINDIIRLSELDHKEMPHKFESVDLYKVAKERCADLQVNALQREITLTCEGSPSEILADHDLIRELIDNLVQNAIRYNKEHGSVQVKVTTENEHPILTVKDTGIGIPEGQQERVFERFYRVDKSRSRDTGGTGLGLAIVKHIAEIHSAEISLQSRLGVGTEVTVRF